MTSANTRKPGHKVLGKVVMTAVAVVAGIAIMAVPASAAAPATVYNNIPSPLPGNLPSVGYRGDCGIGVRWPGRADRRGARRPDPELHDEQLGLRRWILDHGQLRDEPGCFVHPSDEVQRL